MSVVESRLTPSSLKPLKMQQLEGEEGDGDESEEEWDEEGKTPVERWGHDTLQEIYETYYADGGGGDEEPADDEDEAEEKDPCEEVTENAREMPKKARVSDCFGPPHTLCQLECASECMRAPHTPNNMMLKTSRMQMLFGPGDLVMG